MKAMTRIGIQGNTPSLKLPNCAIHSDVKKPSNTGRPATRATSSTNAESPTFSGVLSLLNCTPFTDSPRSIGPHLRSPPVVITYARTTGRPMADSPETIGLSRRVSSPSWPARRSAKCQQELCLVPCPSLPRLVRNQRAPVRAAIISKRWVPAVQMAR